MLRNLILLILLISLFADCNKPQKTNLQQSGSYDNAITAETVYALVDSGKYTEAEAMITQLMAQKTLEPEQRIILDFERERMDRIRRDFSKTENDVLEYIRKYIPEVNNDMLQKWESDKALEYMIIDGEKFYFNQAARNLFRLSKQAKERKIQVDGNAPDNLTVFLDKHIPEILQLSQNKKNQAVFPLKMKLRYTITLQPDAVPEGETVRCWLPYPRNNANRQNEIKLLSANCNYIIADSSYLQRSIYMEKVAQKETPTEFSYEFQFTSYAQYFDLQPADCLTYITDSELYKYYTAQQPPHIVFTDEIKKLSNEIVGNEKNPYLIVRKIYTWISENIPWASAREYATMRNIPTYVLANRHGDCGMQTLLFMTLARYNGIPAKWQSGWMMHPDEVNLHDWAEVYYEGVGWVPVDQSFGLQPSTDEKHKYFYASGIDAYRFIVNDEISTQFYPAKIHHRSETVDFQRGELEWRGGNLYFDKWDYKMEVVEYIVNR